MVIKKATNISFFFIKGHKYLFFIKVGAANVLLKFVITNITDERQDKCRRMRDECRRVKTNETSADE